MATWSGNASFEIPVPDGLTSIPDKFSVTTITGDETYTSDPLEGYSIDNISPSTPTSLTLEYADETIYLNWDPPIDTDFMNFINGSKVTENQQIARRSYEQRMMKKGVLLLSGNWLPITGNIH